MWAKLLIAAHKPVVRYGFPRRMVGKLGAQDRLQRLLRGELLLAPAILLLEQGENGWVAAALVPQPEVGILAYGIA